MSNISNPGTSQATESIGPVNLSVGSGIAISAVWFFSTALSVFAALLFFTDVIVNNSEMLAELKDSGGDSDAALILFIGCVLIMILPGFGAYWLTKMMFGKKV